MSEQPTQQQAPSKSAAQSVMAVLAVLIILALGVVVLVLFSRLHSKTFAVEQRGQELWILKGRLAPFGYAPYQPVDPALAAAYAPITLMGETPGELLNGEFEERDQLDQALFRAFRSWLELRFDSDDPERLAQTVRLLKRAELLVGISSEQREQLKELKAKVAYVEGRARLDDAEVALREAVALLKMAMEIPNRFSREASDLYDSTSPLSEKLGRTVRLLRNAEPVKSAIPEDSASAKKPGKLSNAQNQPMLKNPLDLDQPSSAGPAEAQPAAVDSPEADSPERAAENAEQP